MNSLGRLIFVFCEMNYIRASVCALLISVSSSLLFAAPEVVETKFCSDLLAADKRKVWNQYLNATNSLPAHPRLLETLEKFFPQKRGRALDLGSGAGRDTLELLRRGWEVSAVDRNESALLRTEQGVEGPTKLTLIWLPFEDLRLDAGSFDLVTSSYALPFCRPEQFPAFWNKIVEALKPGGVISCEFFGDRDSWTFLHRSQMTFLNRSELEKVLSTLKVESLEESEFDGPSFNEPQKHWHLYTVVAKKPLIEAQPGHKSSE